MCLRSGTAGSTSVISSAMVHSTALTWKTRRTASVRATGKVLPPLMLETSELAKTVLSTARPTVAPTERANTAVDVATPICGIGTEFWIASV